MYVIDCTCYRDLVEITNICDGYIDANLIRRVLVDSEEVRIYLQDNLINKERIRVKTFKSFISLNIDLKETDMVILVDFMKTIPFTPRQFNYLKRRGIYVELKEEEVFNE